MTQAVVMTDVEGRVVHWSDGASELFGYAAADALGRPVDFLVPEHLREAHWKGFHRAMAEPKIKDMAADLPVVCGDGTVRELAGRLLALSDGHGHAVGALAVYTDDGLVGFAPFS